MTQGPVAEQALFYLVEYIPGRTVWLAVLAAVSGRKGALNMERWKINLYVVWSTQILSIMSFSFGMPFMAYYVQEMGVHDPSAIKILVGILSAAPAITMGIVAPFWGRMADKVGKKPMLLRAVTAGSIVMLGLGLSTHVWQLVLFRFLQGAFTGTITASSALIASTVPEKRLSYALGFLSSSTFIGATSGPALGGLVAEWFGYRSSFLIGAALMLLDVFMVLFFVKDSSEKAVIGQDHPKTIRETGFIKTGWFLTSMALLLLMRILTNIFNPYLPLFVQQNIGITGAARTTGLFNGFVSMMTAFSGILLSRLGDLHDKTKLLRIYALIGCGIGLSLYWLSGIGIWQLMFGYGIMMFFVGGIEPLITSSTSSRIDKSQRGALFGLQAMVSSIGWTIYPALGSYVSITWSIPALLLIIPFLLFVIFIIVRQYGHHLRSVDMKREIR